MANLRPALHRSSRCYDCLVADISAMAIDNKPMRSQKQYPDPLISSRDRCAP